VFKFKTGEGKEIHITVLPSGKPNSFQKRIKLLNDGVLSYAPENSSTTVVEKVSDKELVVTISQATIKPYVLQVEKALTANEVSADSGEIIFNKMACATCHSSDGAKSHGPTLLGIAGSQRPIIGMKDKQLADDDYLRESIIDPNKKVVRGFPPNYMPVFKLPKNELDSLILYIKTLKN
jgi:cytochrome c oxidase subunit 2